MGAFVASAAFAAAQATPAAAYDLSAVYSDGSRPAFPSPIGRVGAAIDPRFAILEDALRPRLPVRIAMARAGSAQRAETTPGSSRSGSSISNPGRLAPSSPRSNSSPASR